MRELGGVINLNNKTDPTNEDSIDKAIYVTLDEVIEDGTSLLGKLEELKKYRHPLKVQKGVGGPNFGISDPKNPPLE